MIEKDSDFEFRYLLRDTIVLLGGDPHIADLLKKSLDESISEDDVAQLRNYTLKLLDEAKSRICNINKITVRVGSSDSE